MGDGFLGRLRGSDIARFRCAGRRFVSISHPDYVDHVLHEARLSYVKSNEYEPIRATAGINLLTDEGDSWAAHRGVLNPTFARRHLNGIVDLMIDPIADITDSAGRSDGARFDMHETMVEATLRVVANSLFSQDFGPLVQSMNDLATRGLRHAERLERLGLWGLMPRPVYDALNGLRLLRRAPAATLARHPGHRADARPRGQRGDRPATGAPDRFRRPAQRAAARRRRNVAAAAGPRRGPDVHARRSRNHRQRHVLVLVSDGAAPEARDRMLAEVDDVLGTRRAGADDLGRLPWTTACLQESQRYFSAVWIIARRAIDDDVIGGHHIRRGTTVVIPIHHIHHDPRWWPRPGKLRSRADS